MTITLSNVYISQSRPKVYLSLEEFLNHPSNYTMCSTIQYQIKLGTTKGDWKAVIRTNDDQEINKNMIHKKTHDFFVLELHGVGGTVNIDFLVDGKLVLSTSRPVKVVSRNDLGHIPEAWIQEKKTDLPRGKAAWKKEAQKTQEKSPKPATKPSIASIDVSAALTLVKPETPIQSTPVQEAHNPFEEEEFAINDDALVQPQTPDPTANISYILDPTQVQPADVQVLLAQQMYNELCFYKAMTMQLQNQVTNLQIQLVQATLKRKRDDALDENEPLSKYIRQEEPSGYTFDF